LAIDRYLTHYLARHKGKKIMQNLPVIIVIGDKNAKVGSKTNNSSVGKYSVNGGLIVFSARQHSIYAIARPSVRHTRIIDKKPSCR